MLDLAFTAFLDFLASLRRRPVRTETIPTEFVPYIGAKGEQDRKTGKPGRLKGPETTAGQLIDQRSDRSPPDRI